MNDLYKELQIRLVMAILAEAGKTVDRETAISVLDTIKKEKESNYANV